jgi:hypothetical protein
MLRWDRAKVTTTARMRLDLDMRIPNALDCFFFHAGSRTAKIATNAKGGVAHVVQRESSLRSLRFKPLLSHLYMLGRPELGMRLFCRPGATPDRAGRDRGVPWGYQVSAFCAGALSSSG